MNGLASRTKTIILVSGFLTGSMIYAALTPQAALMTSFGTSLEGPLAEVMVRNWGALIGLIGALLMYGAFFPTHRLLIMTVAGLSKLTFIILMLTVGRPYLGQPVGIFVAIDILTVLLFAACGAEQLRDAKSRPPQSTASGL